MPYLWFCDFGREANVWLHFYSFFYIYEWWQILLKNRSQRIWITVVLGFIFHFFEAALFYHFCLLAFDFLYDEALQHFGNSINLFWVTFHEEKYRINSFAQLSNKFITPFIWNKLHCSFLKVRAVNPIFSMCGYSTKNQERC